MAEIVHGADGSYTINGLEIGASGLIRKEYIFAPIEWGEDGATPPADAELIEDGTYGKVRVRKFDSSSDEDLVFPIELPPNITGTTIRCYVVGVITEATGPSSETLIFQANGACAGHNDGIDVTPGDAQKTQLAAFSAIQYDRFKTDWSPAITVTDLAASEIMMLYIYRDSDDTYNQDIGVSGIVIEYYVQVETD